MQKGGAAKSCTKSNVTPTELISLINYQFEIDFLITHNLINCM